MKIFLKAILFSVFFISSFYAALSYEKAQIIGLINQTIESERYWNQMNYSPLNRVIHRSISSWVKLSWSNEIKEHLEALKELKTRLAQTLAALDTDKNYALQEFKSVCTHAQKTVADHGKPSHLSRNWIAYSCLITIAAAIALKTKKYLNTTKIFEFESTQEQFSAVFNRLAEKKSIQFDAVQHAGKNYIKVPSKDQWLIQEAINHILKDSQNITERNAQITDAFLYFYNEQGNNRIKVFLDKSLLDPVKNIYWKIFKEPIKKSILTCNTETHTQDLRVILTKVAQDALEQKDYDGLFTPFEVASRKLASNKSIEELQAIHHGILHIAETNIAHNLGRALSGRKVALVSALIARAKEIDMKMAELISDVAIMIEKQNIVIELVAMLPGALLTYLGYKGISSTLKNRHKKLVLNPLAQDLRDFEILLDEYRDTDKLDDYFYGMRIYWVTKLESYLESIATEQRVNFNHDITRLKNKNFSIEHQLHIVTGLLRYGLPNF